LPQHLSLGTKEQRKFQDPDDGGRAKKVDMRWPKGGTKEYLGTSKNKQIMVKTLVPSTSEP
jgi:hypothetical protein